MSYRLCVLHSFDPRGAKVGGLETFIRQMIEFLPDDFTFLMIGVDAVGDLELGKVTKISVRGKSIDFLPMLHYPESEAREAAKTIGRSINFQFMRALVNRLPAVRRLLKASPTSVDLQRVEFAPFVRALGIPFVQMLHGEGAPKLKMDSLLNKYRYVHVFAERAAMRACDRFFCVNPILTKRMQATYPAFAHKIGTLSTWVDTKTFRVTPFPPGDAFRVAFAGRLDWFKVPPLMFKTIDRLRAKLGCPVEFHYMGTSDAERFPEFALIRDATVLHGFKTAEGVAEVLGHVHAGILTSEMEGMPFSVLETLAVGRPVCAIHLPQLASVIRHGVSGTLVARDPDSDVMAENLAEAFMKVREAMIAGRITPEGVQSQVADLTPERQLAICYRTHRELQDQRAGRRPGTRPAA